MQQQLDVFVASLTSFWTQLASFVPQLLAALLLLFVGCRLVEAQVVRFVANGGFRPGNEKVTTAFTLPTQPTDVKDALDEFQRMAKHEQWEKAFKALETIAEKGGTGFIDRGDGILVPGRLVVRRLVAELPAAGKSAYRVFYDAQAEALLRMSVDERVERLTTVIGRLRELREEVARAG